MCVRLLRYWIKVSISVSFLQFSIFFYPASLCLSLYYYCCTMQACRRIYVGLLVLVLIAITGMVYKWHAVSQLRSSTTTAVATTDDDNMSTWTYDKDDPRMIRAQQRIDMKYCGGPCRFLLPVFIMEQGNHCLWIDIKSLRFGTH